MGFSIKPQYIQGLITKAYNNVLRELPSRAVAASVELRNAELEVMRGSRSGRTYRTPLGTTYTASAPGEPPAVRTGTLKSSFRPVNAGEYNIAIETNVPYAEMMENGSPGGMIKPRPYREKTIELARPKIEAIYKKPFDLGS